LFVDSQLHTSKDVPANVIFPAGHIHYIHVNTLRTGDADLRFYITTVQDG